MKSTNSRNAWMFIACVISAYAAISPSSQSRGNETTDFITEQAFAVVIATPERAMLEPALELLPREIFSVMSEDELGFNVTTMKKLTVIVEKMETMDAPPGFGFAMEFAEPQNLSENLIGQMRRETLSGKTFYAPANETLPGFLILDDETILFGSKSTLERMADLKKGATSPLIDLVNRKHTNDHIQAFVDFESIRPFIKDNFGAQLRSVPAPFTELAELPFQIASARLTVNMGAEGKIALVMAADDQEKAIAANEAINNGIDLGRQMLVEQMMAEMTDENPRMLDAMRQYFQRVGDKIVAELKPERVGSNLMWDYEDTGAGMTTYAGIGVAMLLPAVQATRSAARRVSSQNNLRQIVLAAHNYESTHRRFPASANFDDSGKPLLSWRVHLLPYLEQQALYEQFHLDEPWDSAHNKKLISQMPMIYQCPSIDEMGGKTVYLGIAGEDCAFNGEKQGRRMSEFIDGTSNTAMFVEANASQSVIWTKPDDWEFKQSNPLSGLGDINPGVFQVAFADGSVQTIAVSVDSEVWQNMVIVNDRRVP